MSAKEAVIEAIRAMPEGLSEPEIVAELTSQFDPEPELPEEEWLEAWLPEWERRLEDSRAGKTQDVPGEEFMQKMREKYG